MPGGGLHLGPALAWPCTRRRRTARHSSRGASRPPPPWEAALPTPTWCSRVQVCGLGSCKNPLATTTACLPPACFSVRRRRRHQPGAPRRQWACGARASCRPSAKPLGRGLGCCLCQCCLPTPHPPCWPTSWPASGGGTAPRRGPRRLAAAAAGAGGALRPPRCLALPSPLCPHACLLGCAPCPAPLLLHPLHPPALPPPPWGAWQHAWQRPCSPFAPLCANKPAAAACAGGNFGGNSLSASKSDQVPQPQGRAKEGSNKQAKFEAAPGQTVEP